MLISLRLEVYPCLVSKLHQACLHGLGGEICVNRLTDLTADMGKFFNSRVNFISWDENIALPLLLLFDLRVLRPRAFNLAIAE